MRKSRAVELCVAMRGAAWLEIRKTASTPLVVNRMSAASIEATFYLERELEKAIADVVVVRLGLKSLPLMPPRETIQMMAKAAVAVYEGAVETCRKET